MQPLVKFFFGDTFVKYKQEGVMVRRANGVQMAIDAVGGQSELAALMGTSQQNVSKWLGMGWLPTRRIIECEQLTGIPRLMLVNPRLLSLLAPTEL